MSNKSSLPDEVKQRNEAISYLKGRPTRGEVINFLTNAMEQKYIPRIKEELSGVEPSADSKKVTKDDVKGFKKSFVEEDVLKKTLDERDAALSSYMNQTFTAMVTVLSTVLIEKGITTQDEMVKYVDSIIKAINSPDGGNKDGEESKGQGK